MNNLVKILSDDDGISCADPQWCLIDPANRLGPATLCSGEFFGLGESACQFETKAVKSGGITCPKCLDKLRAYKAVKL